MSLRKAARSYSSGNRSAGWLILQQVEAYARLLRKDISAEDNVLFSESHLSTGAISDHLAFKTVELYEARWALREDEEECIQLLRRVEIQLAPS